MMNAEIWLWLAIIATTIAIVAMHIAQVELRKALREMEKVSAASWARNQDEQKS